MKFLAVFVLTALMALSVQGQRGCKRINNSCSASTECCTAYCCRGKCQTWGTNSAELSQANPCLTMSCPRGRCFIQEGSSTKKPGIAKCVRTW